MQLEMLARHDAYSHGAHAFRNRAEAIALGYMGGVRAARTSRRGVGFFRIR